MRPEESGSLMSCWANAGDTGPCYWTENQHIAKRSLPRAVQPTARRVVDAAGLLITLRSSHNLCEGPKRGKPHLFGGC